MNLACIPLTIEESKLYEAIVWDWSALNRLEDVEREIALHAAGRLTESLLERGALPQKRVSYFTDPDLNPGGRGKSRLDVFEGNGTAGSAIYRHPHFLPHLRFFLHGPALPQHVADKFEETINDFPGTEGMMIDALKRLVRKESKGKDLVLAFEQAAIECDRPDLLPLVRTAAKSAR